jgi:hypothetical protein
MGGALDAEVAHLALDDPRVGPQTPAWQQVAEEFGEGVTDGPE